MPVLTGSVHAHILTKPSRAGFAVIRLELIEPGAETCVYQAKACSPTDQPVRKFKDGLGINMTMKTFFILTYHIMFRVVPAAYAKPHAQQQIARDLEVDYENFLTNVTRKVWSAHARASVCTLLVHAPGLVSCVRQHASCQP